MTTLMKPDPRPSWSSGVSAVAPAPCLLLIEDSALPPPLRQTLADQVKILGGRSFVLPLRPGHAQHTRRAHLRELAEAYDAMVADVAQGPAGKPPVWVVAAGYGAYLATLLSHRRAIDRMLLRSPKVYADSGWDLSLQALDERHAKAAHHSELAPNDNLAFCAASDYLGQVLIVDGPTEDVGTHGLHVDYFHAFSRARARNLQTLRAVSSARTADDFPHVVQRWLGTAR
ncbi:MAG: hypothetical protein EOO29_02200 [Comamonadaceae bacterium]|nr:MAG: hypothetical protein EOO29_02200 [Comamonadaceae bacterium]